MNLFKKIDITKRFYLYGFLKDLQFFEPFLILFFLEKGLSYFKIGVLISIREITINILEIPSGIAADNFGKRRSMIICFVSYIISFIIFFISNSFINLIIAIIVFGIGDAFRTGTHKAIVMDILDRENKKDILTKVFGNLRFFAKTGGALSGIIASILVFITTSYKYVFLFNLIPYTFALFLIMSYPKYLDERHHKNQEGLFSILKGIISDIKNSLLNSKLRKLLANSLIYEGSFKIGTEYLQPYIVWMAAVIPALVFYNPDKYSAFLVGGVYFVLKVFSAFASVISHKVEDKMKDSNKTIILLNIITALFFIMIGIFYKISFAIAGIVLFISVYIFQNVRRPIMLSVLSKNIDKSQRATILSIESQGKSGLTFILAPVIGYIADSYHIGAAIMTVGIIILIFSFYFSSNKNSAE